MPPIDDDELDRLLRDAAPRAPGALAGRVMARLQAASRARRRLAWTGAVVAAAAAVLLTMHARRPSAPSDPALAPGADAWRVARADGAVSVAPSGVTPEGAVSVAAGGVLPEGGVLTVAAGGRAELERGAVRFVLTPRLDGTEARARVVGGALVLDRGSGELDGDGAAATTSMARVIALGDDAQVSIDLSRRPTMSAPLKTAAGAAALTVAVLSVYVLRGSARVEASAPGAGAALLNHGDRALVADGTPTLALRVPVAPAPVAMKHAPDEHAKANTIANEKPAAADSNERAPGADDNWPAGPAVLDKEQIRDAISAVVPGIQKCYESALEKNPKLAGRVVVEMKIRAHDGKGKLDEAEVLYDESRDDDLDSPATEHCLLEQLSAAEFPKPKGEGEVIVRYPFVLKPSDE